MPLKVELSKRILSDVIYRGDGFKLVLSVRYDKIVFVDRDVWYEVLEIGDYYEAVTDTDAVLLEYINTEDYKGWVMEDGDEYTDTINEALKLIDNWKKEGYYVAEEVV